MNTIWEVLTFRRMVAPGILQILFWGGIGGTLYGSWVLIQLDHWAWWVALVFGSLLTRVIFERAILSFRAYDRVTAIERLLREERQNELPEAPPQKSQENVSR